MHNFGILHVHVQYSSLEPRPLLFTQYWRNRRGLDSETILILFMALLMEESHEQCVYMHCIGYVYMYSII